MAVGDAPGTVDAAPQARPMFALLVGGVAALAAGRGIGLTGVAALGPLVVALATEWPLSFAPPRTPEHVGRDWAVWPAAVLAAFGLWSIAPWRAALALFICLSAAALVWKRVRRGPVASAALLALLCAVFTVAAHPAEPVARLALASAAQAMFGAGAGLVAAAWRAGPEHPLSVWSGDASALAPAALVGACGAGLTGLPAGALVPAALVTATLGLAPAGVGLGTLTGVVAGGLCAVAAGTGPGAAFAAAAGGALAGMCGQRPVWVRALACAIGNAVVAALIVPPLWGWAMGAAVGAAVGLLLGGHRAPQTQTLPAPVPGPTVAPPAVARRLQASALACVQLGRGLADLTLPTGGGAEPEGGLRIAEHVCPGCPSLRACWERKLPRARRMVSELSQAAMTEPVTWQQVGSVETIFCLRPREMADAANRQAALGRQRQEFVRLLESAQRNAVEPLVGIARNLATLAEEVAATAEGAATDGETALAAQGWCDIGDAERLGYDVACVAVPRAGREVSGDAVRCRVLRGDRLALALSDGMGSGEPAAVSSAAAVEHALAALAAGLSAPDALRQTNQQLAGIGGPERFATLDLALIDLRGGALQWYKMGAPGGFLLGLGGLRELGGGGLPAGILPVPEIRSGRARLRTGETLVLVSDGLFDRSPAFGAARGRNSARARWAAEWLRRESTAPDAEVRDVARGLAEAAHQRLPAGAHDDLTVVVCRVTGAAAQGGHGGGDGSPAKARPPRGE